ncbi:MAG: hypothetical protein OEV80_07995, partial [candidate division Zixibacteria bacterium]|nr:hypothetical protein [candidate division Zixibacteria bacterium]
MSHRFSLTLLTLLILLTLTGWTWAGNTSKDGLNPIPISNPNAQLYNDIEDARPAPATFKKPMTEGPFEVQMSGVASSPPSAYFCEDLGYYDDTVTSVWV